MLVTDHSSVSQETTETLSLFWEGKGPLFNFEHLVGQLQLICLKKTKKKNKITKCYQFVFKIEREQNFPVSHT